MSTSTSQPSFALPDTMAMIVLEECHLFPGCFMPLFIFEQRYRQMLDHALQTSRMFCVGTLSEGEILPISTAGLIRASKKQADGTSHVMLYGVTRIRFTGWVQEEPFRIAKIEPIPTLFNLPVAEFDKLKVRALSLLPVETPETGEAMQILRATLGDMKCTDLACDILSYHFVREPETMQSLLAEPCLEKRYKLLLDELERLQTLV
ncbi:MAG: LON peptidase substrate-binding domain-containing protein [Prosthecobacter sp.]